MGMTENLPFQRGLLNGSSLFYCGEFAIITPARVKDPDAKLLKTVAVKCCGLFVYEGESVGLSLRSIPTARLNRASK